MYQLISRQEARAKGLIRYCTGLRCRNEHVAERYVSTGECLECLKRHVPTKERKRTAYRKMKAKKEISDPKWKTKLQYEYRRKYPDRYRAEKLLKAARIHAKHEGIALDFGIEEIREMLSAAIATGAVVPEPNLPHTASLDKTNLNAPISRANIQVVPWWYNRAKWRWPESLLREAMKKFGFVATS